MIRIDGEKGEEGESLRASLSSFTRTMRTWCFTARNPLFLRRRAPRLSGPAGRRRAGRGASLPASPYSFVRGHHVLETQRAFGAKD